VARRRTKYWIQRAVKRPGRVRRYISRVYGNKAFTKDGKIKLEYLKKAKERALRNGNTSLARAIQLAINFRRWK